MRNSIIVLLLFDVFIGALTYFFGAEHWFINSQIGFITSSLIMFGSMLSYKGMVDARLNVGAIPDDERDTLSILEDPYDLYDENQQDDTEKSLVEVVKEERANLKKNRRSLWQATKDSKASFSFYRLGAYMLLIFGFFYLNNNKILDIPIYLFSLFLPSIILVILLMRQK